MDIVLKNPKLIGKKLKKGGDNNLYDLRFKKIYLSKKELMALLEDFNLLVYISTYRGLEYVKERTIKTCQKYDLHYDINYYSHQNCTYKEKLADCLIDALSNLVDMTITRFKRGVK